MNSTKCFTSCATFDFFYVTKKKGICRKPHSDVTHHIKRPLLFFIACMVLWFAALVWLNTSSYQDANYYSSGIVLEGGGPGSAYPPDWDSTAAPLSAAQMDSVLEVAGIPDSMRARVLRRLRPK